MSINADLQALARPIAWFKTDPRNARKHSPRNIKAIADSLRMFGQQKPVVALDDGTIIAGNGTLEAAKSLGMQDLACVVFADAEHLMRIIRRVVSRIGRRIDDPQAAAAERFNKQLAALTTNASNAGRSLAAELLPSVNKLLVSVRTASEVFGGFGAGLFALTKEGEFADAVRCLSNYVKALQDLRK
jgi:hypothetical protein